MFDYLERSNIEDIINQSSDAIHIIIDDSIYGKAELINTINSCINSPYSDDNWDGLQEALIDLSWLKQTVIIAHFDLPKLGRIDQCTYLSVLRYAVTEWTNELHPSLKVYFVSQLANTVETILQTI